MKIKTMIQMNQIEILFLNLVSNWNLYYFISGAIVVTGTIFFIQAILAISYTITFIQLAANHYRFKRKLITNGSHTNASSKTVNAEFLSNELHIIINLENLEIGRISWIENFSYL